MSNDYAYIIIGSGVAGSTVATKLLEAHPETPILMLEAGPQIPMKDRRYWWDYVLYKRKAYDPCEDRDGDNPSVGGAALTFPIKATDASGIAAGQVPHHRDLRCPSDCPDFDDAPDAYSACGCKSCDCNDGGATSCCSSETPASTPRRCSGGQRPRPWPLGVRRPGPEGPSYFQTVNLIHWVGVG